MKIVYNNIIPFKGFSAINLFGIIFARKGVTITQRTINHESIHTKQMKELLYIGFYLWYLVEWIIRLFQYKFKNIDAYRAISFEQEAYDNDYYALYLEKRLPYAFIPYLLQKKKNQ